MGYPNSPLLLPRPTTAAKDTVLHSQRPLVRKRGLNCMVRLFTFASVIGTTIIAFGGSPSAASREG